MEACTQVEELKKVVRIIPPEVDIKSVLENSQKLLRVAAYCRVSTKQEEQLNSYENQYNFYTEKINSEPGWKMAGIFADKGITGTSVKKREEFNKLMQKCRHGKVDMIITKSIARFARNTLDCLKYTRELKALGVDVFFEEQGIHSTQPGAEFYITIYGCIAQSESENISANVKWGKAQSSKEGKVAFHYRSLIGYKKGADGKPEIDPEGAEIIKRIYRRFLEGASISIITNELNADKVPLPSEKGVWYQGRVISILRNEKYKGDAILNKTYVVDCISKKVKLNDSGERPMYYVENSHPAIIDAETFARVQEELTRRLGKPKVKEVGTKTQQGHYSSKYALSERLICGECQTPYRRCTWTVKGQKKIVWRCIKRLDFGKKYCHNSPTIEETQLHSAIMEAIVELAKQSGDVIEMLKTHIMMGLEGSQQEDNSMDIKIRIYQIDLEFKEMLGAVAADNMEAFDEEKVALLMREKDELRMKLEQIENSEYARECDKSRISEICTILDGLENHPMEYDDQLVRQVVQNIIVESKEQLKIIFIGGMEVVQPLE